MFWYKSILLISFGYFEEYGPLARCVKLRVAHAPGMPGPFSPPPTSKETVSYIAIPACITARASRTCRDACRNRLTRGDGEGVPGIPRAYATRNFTYLARGPWSTCIQNELTCNSNKTRTKYGTTKLYAYLMRYTAHSYSHFYTDLGKVISPVMCFMLLVSSYSYISGYGIIGLKFNCCT